jgi:hypothetical protein
MANPTATRLRGSSEAAAPHTSTASHPDNRPISNPVAGDLQPAMTLREVGGQAPAHAHDLAHDNATQSVQTDLGTLVDRLIAARDVGGTTRVGASIAHSDFGRIDLSFAPDTSGITVGMHSRDPEFAPSVQAAASLAPPTHSSPGPGHVQPASSQASSNQPGPSAMETGAHGSSRDQNRNGAAERKPSVQSPSAIINHSTDRGEAAGIYV